MRLLQHVSLEASAAGDIAIAFGGQSVPFGRLSPAAADRARDLATGLPLSLFTAPRRNADKELDIFVRRLAERGLIEYRLGHPRGGGSQVVIEPQLPDYWPRLPRLRDTDTLVLSRFAYLRRRADELVLESPRSGALFKIADPKIAALLATLVTPQTIKNLRRQPGSPGLDLLALLLDCQVLFKVSAKDKGLRPSEGDSDLVLWDFHDLLFHARSTEGRHANPVGGVYAHVGTIAPRPAIRPNWPGEKIDLLGPMGAQSSEASLAANLFTDRHSTRDFDDRRPITLAELARFLDATARVRAIEETPLDPDGDPSGGGPTLTHTMRPYPSGGASYELELYLAVNACEDLPRGFYHYDAGAHALVPIAVRPRDFHALLQGAEFAMGGGSMDGSTAGSGTPQILVTVAARFGRVSWKYSSIAYALILKDTGVLIQTFYLMAADMGLGGCAVGTTNIELFAKMTGLDLHVEGAVGQFALGRGVKA